MSYSTVDFMEVRRLVLQHETDPGLQPRLEDSTLFRASNEIHRIKAIICNLRERAKEINKRLVLIPQVEEIQLQPFEEEGSIWFDESIFSEVLCMVPIAVARCPDLLYPEILVLAVITTKNAGSLLRACLMCIPLLRKQCIELLADFICKYKQISHIRKSDQKPLDSLLFYCLQQSYNVIDCLSKSESQFAFLLRQALLQRCICASVIIQITVDVLKDGVDFFTRVLFCDEEIRHWMVSCIKSIKRTTEIGFSSLEVLKQRMLTERLTSVHWDDELQLKEETVLQLFKAIQAGAEAAFHDDRWNYKLYCHLKLYCVLVHLCALQPCYEEVIFWLRALTCPVDSSGSNDKGQYGNNLMYKRRFDLGIAFLFLVPGFHAGPLTENLFRDCVHFFLGSAISNLVSHEQRSVIAVWLVVQLLLQCYDQVCKYCSKAIGMNIRIASMCWEDICCVANETGIISDAKSVIEAASSLQPTGPICSRSDQLELECLFQLLKSGHFIRFRVDITESIMQCILFSVEPIHPMLVEVIEIFAEASCTSASVNSSDTYKMKPLPCNFVAAAIKPFSSCSMLFDPTLMEITVGYSCESTGGRNYFSDFVRTKSAAPSILASFYVLCRGHFLQSQGHFLGDSWYNLNNRSDEEISWLRLLRFLPVDKLLAYMESHSHSCEHIYPRWVGLAISIFPERFRVAHMAQILEAPEGDLLCKQEFYQLEGKTHVHDNILSQVFQNGENNCKVSSFDENSSIRFAREIFRNSFADPVPTIKLLKAIRMGNFSGEKKLELHVAVVECMVPLLLEKFCSDLLYEAFCDWWYSLDQVNIEHLIPFFCRHITVSAMNIDEGSLTQIQSIGTTSADELLSASNLYHQLIEQPLSILACRTEIYHTPLLSILLDILMQLLVRNRRMCLIASMSDGERKKQETLRALDTRDSAICQVLLENWSKMSSLDITTVSVLKTGSLICGFISSLFYSSPFIFRVVHFQVIL
ncbi:PREDICTED: uncharacterized protein LOC104586155 isoform X3 [Nelumbo nucifera]|uniref:Uncharacterized protein LOC104586155 isoform X3 n=1 Tax=Nelumbo nucifera TaxID=4432 RepID=A0A1U8QBN3_NELNU|nr:PREDICTED: uncharacterized protein LOC104586155 isoform X3 [Nelumbo nucifera]